MHQADNSPGPLQGAFTIANVICINFTFEADATQSFVNILCHP
jgi:hypothetical protein